MSSNFPFVRLASWQKLTLILALAGVILFILSFRKFDLYDRHHADVKKADTAIDWYELQVSILFGKNPAMNGVYFKNGDYYLDNNNNAFRNTTGVDITEVAALQKIAFNSKAEIEKIIRGHTGIGWQ